MKHVIIYTDGSSRGNPGPGGYGAVVRYGEHVRELAQGYRVTTNNRMEILAAIAGLELLKEPCRVTLYSDSRYVVDAQTKGWVEGWKKRGWRKKDKSPVKNVDLWQRLERRPSRTGSPGNGSRPTPTTRPTSAATRSPPRPPTGLRGELRKDEGFRR